MTPGGLDGLDETILQFYNEGTGPLPLVLPPNVVWFNLVEERGIIEKSPDTITRRIQKLRDLGLLERVDYPGGYYQITATGRDILTGEQELAEILPDSTTTEADPLTELEWGLLKQIDDEDGFAKDDDYLDKDRIKKGVDRLLQYGFIDEQNGVYQITERGTTALKLQDVYTAYGAGEFFSRLADTEGNRS